MKKLLFIINPIAGKKAGKNISKEILKYLDMNQFSPEFKYSEYPGHISQIASDALPENFAAIIAVGGDGTVNETARNLVHTHTPIGIIPVGSGNGLARHLKIPLKIKKAIELINRMEILTIDSIRINEAYSFCVAGIGFDAQASRVFQNMKTRGLFSYVIACLRCFKQSKDQKYMVRGHERKFCLKAFMLCFANASQFGNNAFIAPDADVTDGKINLVLVKKPSLLQVPTLAFRIMTGKVKGHSCWSEIMGNDFTVIQQDDYAHLDGEPFNSGRELNVQVEEKALNIIC